MATLRKDFVAMIIQQQQLMAQVQQGGHGAAMVAPAVGNPPIHENLHGGGVLRLPLWEEYARELKLSRQEGTVQGYHDMFDSLLNRVKLIEEYVVSHFVSGLKEEIQWS
ncbi:hypothetical protein Droror1_Dr00012115, partial [Drosera rotundifolia]